MKIKVGDWVVINKRAECGLDIHADYTDEEPKYLYEVGSGGRVIWEGDGDVMVEFHWGKYNYQSHVYKTQPLEQDVTNAKGGWYVDKYCLTVLPKGLTKEQMKALGKVMI